MISKFREEGKNYIKLKDSIQASEKFYKVHGIGVALNVVKLRLTDTWREIAQGLR